LIGIEVSPANQMCKTLNTLVKVVEAFIGILYIIPVRDFGDHIVDVDDHLV